MDNVVYGGVLPHLRHFAATSAFELDMNLPAVHKLIGRLRTLLTHKPQNLCRNEQLQRVIYRRLADIVRFRAFHHVSCREGITQLTGIPKDGISLLRMPQAVGAYIPLQLPL